MQAISSQDGDVCKNELGGSGQDAPGKARRGARTVIAQPACDANAHAANAPLLAHSYDRTRQDSRARCEKPGQHLTPCNWGILKSYGEALARDAQLGNGCVDLGALDLQMRDLLIDLPE